MLLPAGIKELFEMVRFEKTDQSYDIWLDEKKKLSDKDFNNSYIVREATRTMSPFRIIPCGADLFTCICARTNRGTGKPVRYSLTTLNFTSKMEGNTTMRRVRGFFKDDGSGD